jgi:fucose 4-O-acetylase-like acetyltransferase
MNMKKFNKFIVPFFALALFITIYSCIIQNPKPEECEIVTATISKIIEESSYDIVFVDKGGDRYYINRGLEQGLNLQDLNASVLNKTVTLHLAKILGGMATSEHIAQLAVNDNIIFTEFN